MSVRPMTETEERMMERLLAIESERDELSAKLAEMHEYVETIQAERDEARRKASEYHRRAQQAEAVVTRDIEDQMNLGGPGNVGRALANVAVHHYMEEVEQAEAQRDRLAEAIQRAMEDIEDAEPGHAHKGLYAALAEIEEES